MAKEMKMTIREKILQHPENVTEFTNEGKIEMIGFCGENESSILIAEDPEGNDLQVEFTMPSGDQNLNEMMAFTSKNGLHGFGFRISKDSSKKLSEAIAKITQE